MSLRIGVDLDGVLADFALAYHDVELRLFGPAETTTRGSTPEEPGQEPAGLAAEPAGEVGNSHRRRDIVWHAIRATPDFWTTLQPIDARAVARLHALTLQQRWEIFFITQRPATEGETVQRQTQRWLVEQGFDLPSVLVIPGSRGSAAAAVGLDYHVDDSFPNCVDVKSESQAKPLLIADASDEITTASARRLGIGTAANISECLDILEQASAARSQPALMSRIAKLVGWK